MRLWGAQGTWEMPGARHGLFLGRGLFILTVRMPAQPQRHLKAGWAPAAHLPPQGEGSRSVARFSPSPSEKAVHAFLSPDLGATRSQESV